MTLAEIIRAQLATGRPLRVTRALLEALDASETDSGDLAAYDRARAAERELADLDLVLPAACGSRVDAARELARERDEERARANEWLAQKHDAERERDEAQRHANAWADERDVMRRERDEARVEVERLRQEADTVAVPEGGVPRERWLRVGPAVVVALRAEVERLTAERAEIDRLRATLAEVRSRAVGVSRSSESAESRRPGAEGRRRTPADGWPP